MTVTAPEMVLASRSPRRLELLSLLVPRDSIRVQPPDSAEEAGFESLDDLNVISRQLRSIAHAKCRAVRERQQRDFRAIVAADTTIAGLQSSGRWEVLGQPPESSGWEAVVRQWFDKYYFGKSHLALTAVVAATPDGRILDRVVTTRVTFSDERREWLDWYLSTGESRGKAGGYALQGLASVFVERVEGSLSNVVGLPVAETRELLLELDVLT